MIPKHPVFFNATHLAGKIDAYFRYIEGDYHIEQKQLKDETVMDIKVYDREPEPPSFASLMYYLGFHSRQQFELYEQKSEFGYLVSRGRLRIESVYEKKLHQQSPTGAIFALKSLGWSEKNDITPETESKIDTLSIQIVNTGSLPAGSEKEVSL